MEKEVLKSILKGILLGLLAGTLLFILFGCEKEPYEGSYSSEPYEEVVDTSDWHNDYAYAGVLDNPIDGVPNEWVGTRWVLTRYLLGYANSYPNDTIEFLSNTTYNVNSGGARTYTMSSLPSSTNKELTLNYFFPFGGSHYSGQISGMFVNDLEINNAIFIDLQNSSVEIRAWFERIQ